MSDRQPSATGERDPEIDRLVALCAERPDDAIEFAIEYGMVLARRASAVSEKTPHIKLDPAVARDELLKGAKKRQESCGHGNKGRSLELCRSCVLDEAVAVIVELHNEWADDLLSAPSAIERPNFTERAPQDVADVRRLEWLFKVLNDTEIKRKVMAVSDVHAGGAMHGIRMQDWRHSMDVAMQQYVEPK